MVLSSSAPANAAANKAQQHTCKAFLSAAFMHVCRVKRDRVGQNKHVSTAGTPPMGHLQELLWRQSPGQVDRPEQLPGGA